MRALPDVQKSSMCAHRADYDSALKRKTILPSLMNLEDMTLNEISPSYKTNTV